MNLLATAGPRLSSGRLLPREWTFALAPPGRGPVTDGDPYLSSRVPSWIPLPCRRVSFTLNVGTCELELTPPGSGGGGDGDPPPRRREEFARPDLPSLLDGGGGGGGGK